MATIQRRRAKDGTLSYRVRIQRKGQPVISATFPTRKECLRYASVIEGQIAEGRHFTPKPTPMTLAEVLVKYTAECLPRKAPQTQHDEVWYLNYWNKTLGHKLLSEITPRDLSTCRDLLLQTHKPSSVIRILRTLSAVLTAAVKEFGVLDANPMMKVKMPAQEQGKVRWLTDDERERLLLACQHSQNTLLYPLVLCAVSTGMRCRELLNIHYADIDLQRGVIHLERTKTKRRRDVPVIGKALDILREMRQGHDSQDYVFPATNRQAPFRSYRKAWAFALKRAQIADFTWHCLRHTCASYLAQAGVPLYTIGTILGHVSPSTTAIYAHLHLDNLRAALATVSQRLSA